MNMLNRIKYYIIIIIVFLQYYQHIFLLKYILQFRKLEKKIDQFKQPLPLLRQMTAPWKPTMKAWDGKRTILAMYSWEMIMLSYCLFRYNISCSKMALSWLISGRLMVPWVQRVVKINLNLCTIKGLIKDLVTLKLLHYIYIFSISKHIVKIV